MADPEQPHLEGQCGGLQPRRRGPERQTIALDQVERLAVAVRQPHDLLLEPLGELHHRGELFRTRGLDAAVADLVLDAKYRTGTLTTAHAVGQEARRDRERPRQDRGIAAVAASVNV